MAKFTKPESTIPHWAIDDGMDRKTPYREDELDQFVEDMMERIADTEAWNTLVAEHGAVEARNILRARLILRDRNAMKSPRH